MEARDGFGEVGVLSHPWPSSIGRSLCLTGAAIGAVGLLGWILGWPILITIVPGQPSMKPNAALAVLLIGIAGALRQRDIAGPPARTVANLAAVVVLVIGVGTLFEYALARDLGIDRLLLRAFAREDEAPYPGRPSPPTALALALLATALLVFDVARAARVRASDVLILSALLIAFVAFVGFLFGAGRLYRLRDTPVIGVSLPTAVSLALVCTGLILERPGLGVMRGVTSRGPGGVMLRRLAIPALLAPLALGPVLTRVLASLGVEDYPLVLAVLSLAMTLMALVLLAATVPTLNRVHAALEASRQRVRDLIELAPDGIFVADLDGRYVDVNDAGCRVLGFERAEIVGKTIVDLIPPGSAERLAREKAQLLAGDLVVSEWALRRKDGRFVPVEVSARILPDGRWQGFVRDISERKRRESEQRLLGDVASALAATLDYEETLQNIAQLVVRDLADICIVETAGDDGRAGRPTVAHRNPGEAPTAAALGGALLELPNDPRELLLVSEVGESYLDSLAIDEERRSALRKLGIESLLALPLSSRGRALGRMVLVSTDPGRRFGPDDLPLAEEVARRAASEVESARLYRTAVDATRARDELLAIVAHDLRNPLTAVLVEVNLMRRRGEPERRSMEGIDTIERSARRMTRLIDDLLEVSRIEVDRLTVECEAVPVSELFRDCIQTQQPLAAEASLEIRLQAEPDLPDVWADHNRLLQVLENLVGNAVKFSKPGGVITLGAMRVAGAVRFSVSDTGSGIPGDELPYVFDRFWQAGRRDRRGAGLGLAIVKGIVEAHGGSVRVESEPGHGSLFSFTIPLASGAAPMSSGRRCS